LQLPRWPTRVADADLDQLLAGDANGETGADATGLDATGGAELAGAEATGELTDAATGLDAGGLDTGTGGGELGVNELTPPTTGTARSVAAPPFANCNVTSTSSPGLSWLVSGSSA
jgi:hypothetical protein